jgi:hypothetical protein
MTGHIYAIVNTDDKIVAGPFRSYQAAKGHHYSKFKGNHDYKIAWYAMIGKADFDQEVFAPGKSEVDDYNPCKTIEWEELGVNS